MTTLKSLVIQLHDNEGLTFQEISDKIAKDYGIEKTRQALNGLYKRTKEALQDKEEKQHIICDVVNIYCIKDNAVQTHEELIKLGIDISYRQVLATIQEEKAYAESVRNTITANMASMIPNINDIRVIRNALEYKGVQITSKRFDGYFEDACKSMIRGNILSELSRVYRLSSNKDMV